MVPETAQNDVGSSSREQSESPKEGAPASNREHARSGKYQRWSVRPRPRRQPDRNTVSNAGTVQLKEGGEEKENNESTDDRGPATDDAGCHSTNCCRSSVGVGDALEEYGEEERAGRAEAAKESRCGSTVSWLGRSSRSSGSVLATPTLGESGAELCIVLALTRPSAA